MIYKNYLISFIFLLAVSVSKWAGGWAIADDVKLTASVNKTEVTAGERFQVTFQLNTSGTGFTAPNFDKFSVLSGPNQSTSMQWVNGAMSSSLSYSFILVANQEGELTIGSASIKANGKTYSSEPIKVKVVKGAAQQPAQQQTQRSQQQPPAGQGANVSDYVFIKLFLDKSRAYIGEQIIATYKIYFRASIVNNEVERLPSFNGFWTQEVELPQQANTSQEVVNGIAYNVATLKQTILFPQRSGSLEVDPMGLNVVLRVQDNSRPRSIFDQFFGTYRDVKYEINSHKGKVEVIALPEQGKPPGYSGAVGKFSMEAILNKNLVKANEAINLKVSINGKGNIKLIEPFKIDFPADFETYDPKTSDKISVTSSGLNGKKEFEYLLIPRHAGNFTLDPVSFSYFDPAIKQYVVLNSGEMKVDVEKGSENESATAFTSVSKEDVKLIGKDIRFIKTGIAGLREKNRYFFNSFTFYSLIIAPLLGFLVILLGKRKYQSLQKDVTGLKSRRATRVAIKRLSTAKKSLAGNDKNRFYEEIFKALYGYLSDKLSISVSDLSKEKIGEALKNKSVSDEAVTRLNEVLDRCEMARFAPETGISEQQVYDSSASIISNIEEEIK